MMKPSDDTVNKRRDIMKPLTRSDEKMENYSRRTDEKNGKLLKKS